MALDIQTVHARLNHARKLYRLSQVIRWIVSGVAVSGFIFILALLGDIFFHYGSVARWIALTAVLIPFVAGCVLATLTTFRRVSTEAMARRIECSCDSSRNVLINAIQFDVQLDPSSSLRAAIFSEMQDPFPRVRWNELFDIPLLKKLFMGLGGAAILLFLCQLASPSFFANAASRILLPVRDIRPLTRTNILKVSPGDTKIGKGSAIQVEVKLGGQLPKVATIRHRSSGSAWKNEIMTHDLGTDTYSFLWKDVREPFEYTVEAGDATSTFYRVLVRPKTILTNRSITVTPPAYTGMTSASINGTVPIKDILPGSKLEFIVEFNNSIHELKASLGKNSIADLVKIDDRHWKFTLPLASSATLRLDYVDELGAADSDLISLVTKPDAPPSITISSPVEGDSIIAKPDGTLHLEFNISDDIGLASLELFKSSSENPYEHSLQKWEIKKGRKTFQDHVEIPLDRFTKADDMSATYCLVAKDNNSLSGPGVTASRPVVVQFKGVAEGGAEAKKGSAAEDPFYAIIKLQEKNLIATKDAQSGGGDRKVSFAPILDSQSEIEKLLRAVAQKGFPNPSLTRSVGELLTIQIPQALLAMRTAMCDSGALGSAAGYKAAALEAVILERLRGSETKFSEVSSKEAVTGLIEEVEKLFIKQRDLVKDTTNANTSKLRNGVSQRQDELAESTIKVKDEMTQGAQNPSLGDKAFRDALTAGAAQIKNGKVYEMMLSAAENIDQSKLPQASTLQQNVLKILAQILSSLNSWQVGDAEKKLQGTKEDAAKFVGNLSALAEIQKQIVEKSKELARKTDINPEDACAMQEMAESKDLMTAALEKMLKDGEVFPDTKDGDQMMGIIAKIFEDVKQEDADAAANGELKPSEMAVGKSEELLKALENAKKLAEAGEMSLPDHVSNMKMDMENFDKTEMPNIPMLTLPEQQEDLIGDLQKQQQDLADQVASAANNELKAGALPIGKVMDGPQGSFGAQGMSGNQAPKNNEQDGRSTGGREGMSSGEMAGKVADNLEGSKAPVRRTSDKMQSGQVEDNGPAGKDLATGGGKSGGYSLQGGMDGDAPVKKVNAPVMAAMNAAAAAQAQLAEKTSKQVAQASLLYLHSGSLAEVPKLMDASTEALRTGKLGDFINIHRQIVAKLDEVRGDLKPGAAVVLSSGGTFKSEKRSLGGDEGTAPEAYQKQVSDYYRSLSEGN